MTKAKRYYVLDRTEGVKYENLTYNAMLKIMMLCRDCNHITECGEED